MPCRLGGNALETIRPMLEIDGSPGLPDRQRQASLLKGNGADVELPLLAQKPVLNSYVVWIVLGRHVEISQFRGIRCPPVGIVAQITLRGLYDRVSNNHHRVLRMQNR